MAASQDSITDLTPQGIFLNGSGATFKVWIPNVSEVYVALHDINATTAWVPTQDNLLVNRTGNFWTGYFAGVAEGDLYRFWVVGPGGAGYKRDPRARELELVGYPIVDCVARGQNNYPWHDEGFIRPTQSELIIYQFHIGVFYASDGQNDIRFDRVSKFLDVIDRIEYLAELGITAIQPLPIAEWQQQSNHDYFSRGYNNTDFYSPEMDYCVAPSQVGPYLTKINVLLAKKGKPVLQVTDLFSQVNQLKVMIDLFHLYGIAVILDVVYNHAGGPMDAQSMRFLNMPLDQDENAADQFFIQGNNYVGGRLFDYSVSGVREFILDNATYFLSEYHVDGFRYDEVSVIVNNKGFSFCQDLINSLHRISPESIHIAEYWNNDRATPILPPPQGLEFDATLDDRLFYVIRDVLEQATGGKSANLELDTLKQKLQRPAGFLAWKQAVTYLENHDQVDADRDKKAEIKPRISALANPIDHRDWYARSRSRVATGLLLTAPGIPMIFMGEEFLEDKPWHNNPKESAYFIYWAGLDEPGPMRDFLKFTRELCWLRRKYPALMGEGINPYFNHNQDRIIAYQRWVEGSGEDVIVICSLSEDTYWHYSFPFPIGGFFYEVFNSDAYDSMPNDNTYNPGAVGNSVGITANGPSLFNQPTSAQITIPANSILVFARTKR